ncbi:hypothetical protein WOLCODRAFT_87441 [Wolfiporia cocos MD-104 SS10]|uniref:CBM21 domain-containing protein n=1 Tax=Wolfiporia cocos (strain MD-104) TaxID=742152 RepID=A0A2H3J3J2_WOLCO|nr:hypothetical protein WOLCODRAFT_87441 [Wolfiporia cocos MD-104 SS10]
MPYALPSSSSSSPTVALSSPPHSPRLGGHRRTRSSSSTFSDERGPGAFVSLGTLPRSHKRAVFSINVDDDDEPSPPPVLRSPSPRPAYLNSLRLSMNTGKFSPSVDPPSRIDIPARAPDSVPFPTSSPPSRSPSPSSTTSTRTPASSLPRTPSTPIILSNGKPLKPSLKSSSSSPNIAGLAPTRTHARAQSAPSTPAPTHKNVHFAEKNAGLETVRVFSRSGKPASLSKPPGDETETETEAEPSYPFPSVHASEKLYEIDDSAARSTTVPAPTYTASNSPAAYSHVVLETLALPRTSPPSLRGTVLARNVAFEKHVAVRFTLDDWQTTSEVTARYVVSLPSLPPPFPQPTRTLGDVVAFAEEGKSGWDRFSFTIRLEDYEYKLVERTLFLAVRYTPVGVGEFWDNNSSQNYRVGFRRVHAHPAHAPITPSAFSAAAMFPSTGPTFQGHGHSQQRTFSAPTTLRTTPTTGVVQYQSHHHHQAAPQEDDDDESEKEESEVRTARAAAQAVARAQNSGNSTPSSATQARETASAPSSPTRAFISKRLSLSNYVAPGSGASSGRLATPPGSPPRDGAVRARSSSLPSGAGLGRVSPEGQTREKAEEQSRQYSPQNMEKKLEPLEWTGAGLGIEFPMPEPMKEHKMTQMQLLSPPDSPDRAMAGLALQAAAEEQAEQEADEQDTSTESSPITPTDDKEEEGPKVDGSLASTIARMNMNAYAPTSGRGSPLPTRERDSSYAALIRQWCFSGTGCASTSITSPGYGGSPYAFPGFGFGMAEGIVGGGRREKDSLLASRIQRASAVVRSLDVIAL